MEDEPIVIGRAIKQVGMKYNLKRKAKKSRGIKITATPYIPFQGAAKGRAVQTRERKTERRDKEPW